MKKVIKYLATALVSAALIFLAVKLVGGTYADTMDSYVDSINAEVEAKRNELLSNGTFREGIRVNGVDIGGMTYDEAKEALADVEKELVGDIGFRVEYGEDQALEFGREYFRVSYNTDEILGDAILLANDGELEALRQQIDDLKKNGKDYEIECKVEPYINLIASLVKDAGDSMNVDPVNASYKPNPKSVTSGGDRFTFVEGKNGYRAKTDEAVAEIKRRCETLDYGTVKIEGEVIEPEIKTSDLAGKIVRRSIYKSSYSHSPYNAPNRVQNIKKACALVNGSVVAPKSTGYVFSKNSVLGPRTEAKGWLPAPGFVDGGARSVDSPGGGVCHVSSTLYNAVIKADLEIVFRINHSSHVGYVPWGQDATIDTRGPDFKFANNTSDYIYIFMWVDTKNQNVCCEIWGKPFPSTFDKIEFYAEQTEEVPPPTEVEYRTDSSLSQYQWYVYNNAKTGYKYQSYKQYYKNGVKVGAPVPVASSYYKMHPKRIAVWKGFNPAVDTLNPAYKVNPPTPGS